MQNIKYFRFFFILCLTGLCFWQREKIEEGIRRIWPAAETESLRETEESGEADEGGNEQEETPALSPEETESTPAQEEAPLYWEYTTVEEDYFDDALFIGDSRTVGLMEYAGLEEHASFYASTGLTIYKLFDAEIVPTENGRENITVEEALRQERFGKIYLMVGINEMGTGTVESFLEEYRKAVEHLQELQPDAIIYVQAILRVSAERSAQGDYIYNQGIDERNEGLSRLADEKTVFYLDVNPLVSDEEGGLIAEYTFDGVHLKAKYISIWKEFLMEHAVRFYTA